MNTKTKYERILFNNETTHRTDYQEYKITAPIRTTYSAKPQCVRLRPPPLKYVHTLADWNGQPVPFSFYQKPKDIVREDPRKIQDKFEEPVDKDREKVQKTRPRVVMTPAVSMDDIQDDKARQLLCKDIYKTTTSIAFYREVKRKDFSEVEIPEPERKISRGLLAPVVPKEWRRESMEWDGNQLRMYCDATREFWLDPQRKERHF